MEERLWEIKSHTKKQKLKIYNRNENQSLKLMCHPIIEIRNRAIQGVKRIGTETQQGNTQHQSKQ